MASDSDGGDDKNAPQQDGVSLSKQPSIEVEKKIDAPVHREEYKNQAEITNQALVDRIDRSDRWMIGLTAAIAAGGIISAVIFGWQLTVMQGQLHEMERAYKPLKDSADATQAAFVAGQRAWIRIDSIRIGGGGLSMSREGISAPIAFVVTNVGNTPALRMWPHVKLTTKGGSLPDEGAKVCDENRQQPTLFGHTLFPNEQFPSNLGFGEYSVGTNLSKEDVVRGLGVDNKHIMLFVVGCIDYTFPTDPTGHHQTPFIRTVSMNEPTFVTIDDGLISPERLVLREFGLGLGRAAD